MSREERVAKRYKDCIDEDFDTVLLNVGNMLTLLKDKK